eukprot:scaffold35407_cov146-Skeletonema_marinoi.AAC.1
MVLDLAGGGVLRKTKEKRGKEKRKRKVKRCGSAATMKCNVNECTSCCDGIKMCHPQSTEAYRCTTDNTSRRNIT